MKIVIASDSFKGSLTSGEVASAAAHGIRSVLPEADIVELEVADGGEGTAEVLIKSLGARYEYCAVKDALGRLVNARYGILDGDVCDRKVAILDVASSGGLALISQEERDIMKASSRGTGETLIHAYDAGCREFLIGLGGSAFCDGGTGMLRALGVRFLDRKGNELGEDMGSLLSLADIDISDFRKEIADCRFTIMTDVNNPLSGPSGASVVFAPQKGASYKEVEMLDECLNHLSSVAFKHNGKSFAGIPGAGAAGGLGWAFMTFFNSVIRPGVEVVLDMTGFDTIIRDADLVITGEGKIDCQTLCGKLPAGVCLRAAKYGIPTVAIAGEVDGYAGLMDRGFAGVFPILRYPMGLERAMDKKEATANVASAAASIVNFYNAILNVWKQKAGTTDLQQP